ncbi:hypothetical protein ACFX2G_034763 [Malus domestica]
MGYLDEATINCEEPKAIISAVNEYAANGNCEQDPKRIISDKIVGYKIEDLELTTSVDEVKKGVWLGLKASTLYDKFTGTSFKDQFALIKRMETIQLEVVVFLDFTFYADEDDDRSVFLVYLKILVRKDHGHHVIKTL